MSLTEFNYNGISWYGCKKGVTEFFDLTNETLVRKRVFRNVSYRSKSENSEPLFFIKNDPSYNFVDKVKSIFRTRLWNEFNSAVVLQQAGVPVVEHIAVGKKGKESCLITRAFNGDSLSNLFHQMSSYRKNKRSYILEEFCRFLCKFIEGSFYHPDLHLDNILFCFDSEKIEFINIDVYGVQKRKLSETMIIEMFLHVFSFFNRFPKFETRNYFHILEAYLPSYSFDQFLQKCKELRYFGALKFTRKRQQKYLANGTRVNSWRKGDTCYTAMRDVNRDYFETLINTASSNEQLFSYSSSYRNVKKCWLNLLFIRRFGVSTVDLIGFAKTRTGQGLLIAKSFDSILKEFNVETLSELCQISARIHQNRILVKNLSFDNFIIDESSKTVKVSKINKAKFNHSFSSLEERASNLSFLIRELRSKHKTKDLSKHELLKAVAYYAKNNRLNSRGILEFLNS